ncbi:type II toxin-antitoxin system HipA family toxin [Rhodanobacter sp. KK11]|jgi:serine/threonine-protein kinase HipA|uniref:type II toxin-antitoxin system HipA family toxin n=1 Tax=Rhodanobacter sp. KK11 TaxID=3083255 RepID=UPI0029665F8E|nr:type II toxin-antitoxin system HipA family toxin [Rhodanobacter sp. KK11]MDW2982850.1 type II toxin-antitoxin system HipA family toxin [Rhodanobacter sp. KK11]
MARARRHPPLRVYQNDQLVGHLLKESGGAIEFRYAQEWLDRQGAFPVSLSLPLREDTWRGEPVVAVFENLLPDSAELRKRVAEKVGAAGYDAYSLLAEIGRDCIGALQFIAGDAEKLDSTAAPTGETVDDEAIERLLNSLAHAPFGLSRDDDFRISVAGVQEKTALLRLGDQWLKPHGTTPTTHLFKTPIGKLKNGMDLSHSVENEFYCLRLLQHLGLPVNHARIMTFGRTKALVVERFDRVWDHDRLIRLPQEDCCQALSVPPARKYQNEGGPGIVELANLLKGADSPADDQRTLFQAQLVFWLIGATDGHAKNFSLFLRSGGRYALTPLYDVLSTQPNLDAHEIERKRMKLAMSVGTQRHYRIDEVQIRHFFQTGEAARLSPTLLKRAIEDIAHRMDKALAALEADLPADFPQPLHASISQGARQRLRVLQAGLKQ